MFHVVVTDRFDDQAFAMLTAADARAANLTVSRAQAPTLSNDDLSNIDGLIIRSRTKIDITLLTRLPKLKVIITSTSGFDHIDLSACFSRGVKVMYTPNANAASAAELTWGLVIAAARKLPKAQAMLARGDWNREPLMGVQLSGKTYGVVGLGRIGQRVARVAKAFGMDVIAFDPYLNDFGDVPKVELSELFARADFISLHVPSTAETTHMITQDILQGAKPDLVFVNTSRGGVIEESLLIKALEQKRIGAVGLDVFEHEPLTDQRLLKNDNVALSPHIGATTREAFQQASVDAAQKMLAFAQHGTLSDELPGNAPWMRK